MSINERFKKIRDELDLSQIELGKRMGRQQPDISKIETGKHGIASDALEAFIKATNLSNEHIAYLMRGEEPDNELQPMIVRERFEEAEEQRAIELILGEKELTRAFSILSYFPDKQKRKLINNFISLIKNEQE